MEQQQFQVSFSVGTKLLMSVVSLLLVVIVFLDVSTILLLSEDKRAYTYQLQSTEAQFLGQQVVSNTRLAVDSLRLSLVDVDLSGQISGAARANFQSLVDNQSELVALQIHLLGRQLEEVRPLIEVSRRAELSELGLSPSDLILAPAEILAVKAQLLAKGFAYLTVLRLGKTPLLAVLLADRQARGPEVPVGIGFVPTASLGKGLRASIGTVTDFAGRVLFSSEPSVQFQSEAMSGDALFRAAQKSQVSEGTLEFEENGQKFIGSFVRPGFDLIVMARTDWGRVMRATYTLAERFIYLGLMSIGAAVLFAVFFSKNMTSPIYRLYQATRQVADGNFNVDLSSRAKDELGALSRSFVTMSKKITGLISESVRKVQLENELAIASAVQQTLLPPAIFENEDILIHSYYQSATECGGDWWGFFGVGRRICVMIADATGHGLPSALITAAARSCFSVMHKLAQEDPDFSYSPGAMLSFANRVVHDAANGQINMTFFIGVIDLDTGELTYSSAGHNPPWLFKKSSDQFSLKSLMVNGQRLGESRDVAPYEEKAVQLGVGDLLFLYTDGLMEGRDQAGGMYGKKRVKGIVETALARGPAAILKNLVDDFTRYNQGKPLDDDVTLAVVQFTRIGGPGP